MSRWTPCKRGDSIRKLRGLGFDGPFSGTRHQFMVFSRKRLAIPSNSEYSVPQLRVLVREVENLLGREVSVEEWTNW
ncbi:MAG: type II toxin-antitoxin system HicA family toxin [Terriglobia bacterium]